MVDWIPIVVLVIAMRSALPVGGDVELLARAILDSGASWEEATWLAAIGYREGSYRLGIVGDYGRARCVYQLHNAPERVLTNADACTRIALDRLRYSMRTCPSEPLAAYAGVRCHTRVAGRISRDRDALRRRMFGLP